MAVTSQNEEPVLLLMPPPADGPTEPRCYGSPAKPMMKREVSRVSTHSSYERLLIEADKQSSSDDAEVEGDCDDEEEGIAVKTNKKSAYMTDEVEEKLQLGGVDPYGLLELEDKRWRASADEIRKSYRRLVLQHHPDKKAALAAGAAKEQTKAGVEAANGDGGEEGEGEEEDGEFKLLSAAWELLGNADRRRAFDSVDYFNDDLPLAFRKGKNFYRTFAAPFARQAKFSEQSNPPALGTDETPYEEVAAFYRFWQNLRSWRDFSLLTEHDLSAAEDREERRWMQRQNKNMTERIKRDEMRRVQGFVQLAYENDPRVARHKEEMAAQKAAAKAAKEEAAKQKQAEAAAVEAAAREEQRQKQAAAEEQRAAESESKAAGKREKERLRSALKKARKELKTLAEAGRWSGRAADIEVLAAALSLEQLQELHAALVAAEGDEAVAAMEERLSADVAKVMAQ